MYHRPGAPSFLSSLAAASRSWRWIQTDPGLRGGLFLLRGGGLLFLRLLEGGLLLRGGGLLLHHHLLRHQLLLRGGGLLQCGNDLLLHLLREGGLLHLLSLG